MALILLQNISKYATVKPYANIRLGSKVHKYSLMGCFHVASPFGWFSNNNDGS